MLILAIDNDKRSVRVVRWKGTTSRRLSGKEVGKNEEGEGQRPRRLANNLFRRLPGRWNTVEMPRGMATSELNAGLDVEGSQIVALFLRGDKYYMY